MSIKTQKAAMEALALWAEGEKALDKLRAKRERDLAPLMEAHNEACRPIEERFAKKAEPLMETQAELEGDIIEFLTAKDRDQTLTANGAIAEQKTETKTGRRVIEPQKFFDAVKAKGAEFWSCLKVEIAKAEKFMGKIEVDKIADKEQKTETVRTVRMG